MPKLSLFRLHQVHSYKALIASGICIDKFCCFPGDKLVKMSVRELEKHLDAVCEALGTTEKGPVSQKRLHLLHYIGSIASASSRVSNRLVHAGVLSVLCRLVKEAQHVEM
jgi:hypothetical protein